MYLNCLVTFQIDYNDFKSVEVFDCLKHSIINSVMKCPEDVKEACLQIMQVTSNSVRFPRGFHRQNYMSSVGYLYEDRLYFK